MDDNSSGNTAAKPQLVIMAAGMGNRYGGLKQLDAVGRNGEALLEYSVRDAITAGFGKVIIVLRREIERDFRADIGRRIEKHIDTAYAIQDLEDLPDGFTTPLGRNKPWGTAHAVLCTRPEVTAPFAVLNADDFYGPGALQTICNFLGQCKIDSDIAEYCLAGYKLDNTLSEHGHVSRGICEVDDDDYLGNIVERTCIRSYPHDVRFLDRSGEWCLISGQSIISMNLWGFTPDFFSHLELAFSAFLETGIWATDNECLLPTVVGLLVSEKTARVKVLPTDEQWYGVTYREDKPEVVRAIAERCGRGDYPMPLWG